MKHLTKKQRWQIVFEMERCGNVTKVAKHVGCSENAVRRWWRVHSATGGVKAKKSSGRKHLMSPEAQEEAYNQLIGEQVDSASEVAKHLKVKGFTKELLDRKTVGRAARRVAAQRGEKLVCERGKPKKDLTENNKLQRIHFAKMNKRTPWSRVMFCDRSKFAFRYPGSQVKPCRWVVKGSKRGKGRGVVERSNPQVLNIYAGITKYGVTKFHMVAGTSKYKSQHLTKKGTQARNITQSEMREVLKQTLLPEGQRLFSSQGLDHWVLQLDGDKVHRVALEQVEEWNKHHSSKVSLLEEWPPHSPDLSPIENLWSWAQAKVNKKGCGSFEEYKEEVRKVLTQVPKGMQVNYFKSMKKRMQLVLEGEGDLTRY